MFSTGAYFAYFAHFSLPIGGKPRVADPDPGSGAFLIPGSEIRDQG
jgi:hypothetical protein